MIIKNEPFLIEYNVRMGDPECQTILPLLKNDFLDLIDSCCKAKLSKTSIKFSPLVTNKHRHKSTIKPTVCQIL